VSGDLPLYFYGMKTAKQIKRIPITLLLVTTISLASLAQQTVTWSEEDRKYLVENLTRSRDELIKETKGLTKAQWSFKESPDRWSINQVVEHIAIWELLMTHRVSIQLRHDPHPELSKDKKTDSLNFNHTIRTHGPSFAAN
jgi:hypothetical protein